MNFVGKFDAKLPVEGSAAHPVAFAHVDGASAHAPSDAIIVPDAQLLFGGDFKRSGVDLVLSKDDHELILHDYFKGEKRAALASPDGAHLTGDLVNALTGHVEYAQADGTVAVAVVVVGHVTKLTGSATAIRNGVSIILNQGDNIDKGDVLQSGADSTLGVTFIDGTVFGMSSNARMVVNEMVYDPNGSNNSSLLSLVAGTISFVAGETAKHGDMKVDTPVATMGIRGTAVLVEIDFAVPGQNGAPSANFQVLVEPDGTTGSYILFDKNTLAPLATVNTAGTLTKISQGVVSFQAGSPLTPDEQKLINDLFTTKFGDNNNTKNTHHAFTDTPVPQSLEPIKLADGTIVTPVIQLVNNSGSGTPSSSISAAAGLLHIPGAPTVVTFDDAFTEHTLITGSAALDTQTGQIRFADVNAGDLPSVKVEFSSFTYQDAHKNDITQALSSTAQTAIKAVEAISLQQDPGNNNNGSATWTYSFPDKAFDFLGAGETLTLTYTALVNNNFAPSPEIGIQQFTITIVGTNDIPVITSSIPQTIAFSGGIHTHGGSLTSHVPTSGTLTFADADLTDTHTVSVQFSTAGLPPIPKTILAEFNNALTASIAADSTGTGFGTVNWKLADLPVYLADFIPKGETITLTYAVTVTDLQGATSTQDITVTITGKNTPAVVWIATTSGPSSGGLWSDGSNWETGAAPTANDDAIIITHQLIGLTPSFPVTIADPAEAKSLKMNNFGTSAPKLINQSTLTIGGAFRMSDHAAAHPDSTTDTDPPAKHTPPELDNQGTLTTGGAFDMRVDSIVDNSGTISVGGLMEVLDASVLENSGALVLRHGGDFKGQSAITNTDTGSIEISGGTLNVQVDIASDGSIKVDAGATLTVGIAAITGGTVTNDGMLSLNGVAPSDPSSGAPPATGEAILKDGTLNNAGVLHAETGAVLEKETVTNTGTIEVLALGALTLDLGTTVDNTGGTIVIDGTGTLTLDDATIEGGTINNYSLPSSPSGSIIPGDIDVTGSSTISNAHLNNGQVTVGANQTLTLDNDTITGTIFADTASGAIIQIDGGTTLRLDHATIDGGTINDFITPASGSMIAGDIDVTGSSTISNAQLNNGRVTIGSNTTLTLSGDTVSGTSFIDTADGATIRIDGASTLDGVAITGGTVSNTDATLTVDADQTLTLQGGATVIGGTVSNFGTVAIEGASEVTLDGVTVTGTGTIQVDRAVPTTSTPLVLEDGTTITDGKLKVGTVGVVAVKTAKGATLNDVAVTNDNSIEVFAASVLALGSGTIIDNTKGIITVDGTGALTLSQATIDGGTINDYSTPPSGSVIAGDIDVTGSSTISNAHLNNGRVTIGNNATLTLDGTTVTGTTFADTADGAVIQIDGGTTLTLDQVAINGGTINDFSTPPSGSVIAGDIDITGSSSISNAYLNNGQVTIGANQTLTLDNDTITGTHFVDTADAAVIQIDGGTTLKLDQVIIDGGTINDFSTLPSGSMIAGDIDVIGSSTISHAQLNYGNVTIESGMTLTLDGDTVTGTAFAGVATGSIIHVDGGDTLALNSATVSGGGVTIGTDALVKTSGDVTLTNTSVTNDGTIEITSGTLKITGSVASSGPDASGSIKIDSGAVLDLDGSDTQNIVFAGANAELKIDASSFGGSISGLAATDEIDLSTIGFGPGTTGTYSGGVLTITDGTHSISMTLTGDYSDAHFAGSSDGHGGTLITLNANDDAPAFDSADTTQIAKVGELADATGSTTSDSSSPASGTIHFTDIDLTDRPTATITQSVTWASGTTDLSSSLTPTEISALEQAFSLTQSGNTNNGAIGWSYQISDSALDFLGAGETARVTSTVLLDDHQNGHDTATVTITITGANDAPVLTADTSGIAGTDLHAIAERAGATGDTADHDSASGTLSFSDADLSDTHTLGHSGPTYVLSGGTLDTTQIDVLTAAGQLTLSEIDSTHSGAGSVGFSYSAPDSSFDFLAEGQTLTVSYTITVTDNSNVSSSQPVTFTITGTNDAPVVDAHNSTLSYTENQAPAAIDAGLTLSDVDSATLGSATVQISGNFVAGEDVLGFIDQNGIHGSYDAVHGILTLTGTSSVANYQAALASVTYFDSSDNPSAAPRTISFSVDDGASANSHSNTATATVDVTPVNDAPVVTFAAPAHGAISVPENTATHLSGISVSDVDAGARDITVTLALPDGSSGSLSAGNFDGVTIGGSAIALTITGSLAEINTFLADTRHGVTYTPATGLIHDVTLTVTANDHGATGSGGALDSAPQPVPLDLVPDGLPASHTNLIVNGGFETGDFSGWKLGNGSGHAIGFNFLVGSEHSENHDSGDMAHHGLKEALFGGIGGDVTLSQSVATNANEHYTVDFWVMNDTSASPREHGSGANDFSASWNGVALMPTIVNADKSDGYTEYQFDVIGAAGHSTLEFSARNDHGYWNLDDVSVREGAPDTVNQLTDETTSVSGVHAGDALTVTPAGSHSLGIVTAAAGNGTVEWQFAASNAQLDHLMGLTQTYTVSDASNPAVAQTIAVSIGGLGHDQFVFHPGVGADTMVNFSTISNSQGNYVGDTIELDKFSNIHSISDVLHNLSTDAHGNAVVDLGNHDSITFQGINAATIQANAMHMFVLHSTSGNMA